MKKCFTLFAVVMLATVQQASADVITSAVVSDGTNTTTLSTTSTDPTYTSGASAVLQSITVGTTLYDTLIAPDAFVGDVEGVLYPIGGTAPTAAVALSDIDLSTGALDPYGTGTFVGTEFFDFTSQTIASDTVFFVFNNGTPSSSYTLVDSTGADISNSLSGAAIGGETLLNNFGFDRTNGGTLATRDVAGNIFAVSDFTFNAGFSEADVVGFRGAGATFDSNDAGIAIEAVAVPEPASAVLLLTGMSAFLLCRRK